MRWTITCAALSLLLTPISAAQADADLVVLGLTSVEGDDDLALSLSAALRRAAAEVTGWSVSPRAVSLSQMALAHGCGESPDVSCLTDIALALSAGRVLYGTIRRSSAGEAYSLIVTLSLFANSSLQYTGTGTIPSTQTGSPAELDPHAKRLIRQLLGKEGGLVAVRTDVPVAEVQLDGRSVGETQDGLLLLRDVAPGRYRVDVTADGHSPYTTQIEVVEGDQVSIQAQLNPGSAPPALLDVGGTESLDAGTAKASPLKWVGVGLMGASALLVGATIYSWIAIEKINDHPDFRNYSTRVYNADPTITDICVEAAAGREYATPGTREYNRFGDVQSMCRRGGTLEVLQWVFLGGAALTGGIGAYLFFSNQGDDRTEYAKGRGRDFSLQPRLGMTSAGVDASLRF